MARRTKSKCPKGFQLKVGAPRAARLLILYISRLYDVDGDGVASKSEVEHITKV